MALHKKAGLTRRRGLAKWSPSPGTIERSTRKPVSERNPFARNPDFGIFRSAPAGAPHLPARVDSCRIRRNQPTPCQTHLLPRPPHLPLPRLQELPA